MCGSVWKFVLDVFDPAGGQEELHYKERDKLSVSWPVCRDGNYFVVPGNAHCAVRLGILSFGYSDSRDGLPEGHGGLLA